MRKFYGTLAVLLFFLILGTLGAAEFGTDFWQNIRASVLYLFLFYKCVRSAIES